jgi:hypothetical protein
MLLFLGTAVWEDFPGAALRVLLPLTLAFNLFVQRTRAPLAWLLIGNLTVFAGFVALRDVPGDPTEIAALRASGTSAIVHQAEGWYGREHHGRSHWSWCSGHGKITLEAWPRTQAVVQLDFSLRALAARNVIILQNGREVWRAPIGLPTTHHSVPLRIEHGQASVEFTTDLPATRENSHADARDLAFALYDLRLTLPKP